MSQCNNGTNFCFSYRISNDTPEITLKLKNMSSKTFSLVSAYIEDDEKEIDGTYLGLIKSSKGFQQISKV